MEETTPRRVHDAIYSLGVRFSGESRARPNFNGDEDLANWYRDVNELAQKLGETVLQATTTDSAVRAHLEELVHHHGPKVWCENPTRTQLRVGEDEKGFFKFQLLYPEDSER